MGNDVDRANAPELACDRWTPIAFRPRLAPRSITLHWIPIDGAPIDPETAHRLRAAGAIFMANRHTREFVELVVRPTLPTEEATGRPLNKTGDPSP
jgi:hypothetical protein